MTSSRRPGSHSAFFLICDLIVARLIAYAFGSVTTATPEGLVIGSGRMRRSRRRVMVPWQVIDSCKPGGDGITIACTDGRRVLSAVPQRTHARTGARTDKPRRTISRST